MFVFSLKKPLGAVLIMGREKEYSDVAIRLDEPEQFKIKLEERMEVDNENHTT